MSGNEGGIAIGDDDAGTSDTTSKPANPGDPGRFGTIRGEASRESSASPSDHAAPASEDHSDAPTGGDSLDLGGVVETALARALVLAAEAQRWDVVQQITGELEARRVARSGGGEGGEVIALDAERARRERS